MMVYTSTPATKASSVNASSADDDTALASACAPITSCGRKKGVSEVGGSSQGGGATYVLSRVVPGMLIMAGLATQAEAQEREGEGNRACQVYL